MYNLTYSRLLRKLWALNKENNDQRTIAQLLKSKSVLDSMIYSGKRLVKEKWNKLSQKQ